MNSTYNYDPQSRKDELVDTVANMLTIIVPALRPDIAIIIGAFPWCESIAFPVSCEHETNMFQVLYLPQWFPGMSFKKQMLIAREYSKQYLERPFAYSLQKVVIVISNIRIVTRRIITYASAIASHLRWYTMRCATWKKRNFPPKNRGCRRSKRHVALYPLVCFPDALRDFLLIPMLQAASETVRDTRSVVIINTNCTT